MNLDLISEPKEAAMAKLSAYRAANVRRVDEEFKAIERGYEALAAGTPLIELSKVIAAGGWNAEGHPALAIARADRRTVRYRCTSVWLTFNSADPSRSYVRGPTLRRSFPIEAMPTRPVVPRENWSGYSAIVPIIPPDVRPKASGPNSKLFILFEAVWKAAPPVDPALLRHLGGDLYAVLATWDLSPLEQAVLAGRVAAN